MSAAGAGQEGVIAFLAVMPAQVELWTRDVERLLWAMPDWEAGDPLLDAHILMIATAAGSAWPTVAARADQRLYARALREEDGRLAFYGPSEDDLYYGEVSDG